jgi:hypothetical protein
VTDSRRAVMDMAVRADEGIATFRRLNMKARTIKRLLGVLALGVSSAVFAADAGTPSQSGGNAGQGSTGGMQPRTPGGGTGGAGDGVRTPGQGSSGGMQPATPGGKGGTSSQPGAPISSSSVSGSNKGQ